MSQFLRLTSLTEVDFDSLFYASLPALDGGTYPWPDPGLSPEAKRNFMYDRMQSVLGLAGSLAFKGYAGKIITSIGIGLLVDGAFNLIFTLVRPDENGSRSFVHDPARKENMKQFLRDHGVSSIVQYHPPGSPTVGNVLSHFHIDQADFSTGNVAGNSQPHILVKIPI